MYPEHEKAARTMRVSDVTEMIGEALDLPEPDKRGFKLRLVLEADRGGERCVECGSAFTLPAPLNRSLAQLVGIDWEKFQAEKDEMLRRMREVAR